MISMNGLKVCSDEGKALYRVQLSNIYQSKKRFNVPGKTLKVIKRTRETSVQTMVEDDETKSINQGDRLQP